MLAIVLYEPEIPGNTGNIIRLCANTGCALHLVAPLGFRWEDKELKRAGLDYHEYASVNRHPHWAACRTALADRPWHAMTTKATRRYDSVAFGPDSVFVFGPESRGLPGEILAEFTEAHRLRLPMRSGQRSLNLSNAVAVTVFEAWRQNGYDGAI